MLRPLTALLLAFACHGLFLLLPFPQDRDIPPRLQGDSAISITLSGEPAAPEESNNEEVVEPPEDIPEQPSPGEQLIQPPPAEEVETQPPVPPQKTVTPVALKVSSRKKHVQTATASPGPAVGQPQEEDSAKSVVQASRQTRDSGQSSATATVRATPLYAENPKPKYPSLARRRHEQGTVLLTVLVSAQGIAERVTVQSSSGSPLLDKSAIRTVKTWHFLPGREGGRTVAMEVLIPVHFRLKN